MSLVARASGAEDYVSPSRLALWLKCPLAFKLRYIDAIRSPASPALFVGKMVHSALEDFYTHRRQGLPLAPMTLAVRLWNRWRATVAEEKMKFEGDHAEEACWRQTLGLVGAYLWHFPADEPKPLAVEMRLQAALIDPATGNDLGIPLVGILDLVLDSEGGPAIVDFKTTSRGSECADITHELQLTAYAYLLRKTMNSVESRLEIRQLVKAKSPRMLLRTFPARSDRHFRRFFSVVRAYVASLRKRQFHFRPSMACLTCELRDQACKTWEG